MALAESSTQENRFTTYTDWDGYLRFLAAVEDRPIRITYDRGRLEIMSPSREHERVKSLLRMLLEALMFELDVPFIGGGSMTFKRQDLDRGMEPDECYWISHWEAVQGRRELDLAQDPPPDLGIEVEVSRSVLPRLSIYAALGVPEVWRYRNGVVEVLSLGAEGRYVNLATSPTFPQVPLSQVASHVLTGLETSDFQMLKNWRMWLRDEFSPEPS